MASEGPIKNVAIVGASGNVGKPILNSLIAEKRFNITVVSRSTGNFPSDDSIKVVSGDYEDDNFFKSAFANQDAVIFALGFMIKPNLPSRLISAAAASGVKYVVPTEFGSDNATEYFSSIPMVQGKAPTRKQIEESGMKWLGIVNNPWLGWSLKGGHFYINAKERKATLLDEGTTKFNSTTLRTVGLAVARMLGQPEEWLEKHGNGFVYISSVRISQKDLLESVQRVTETKDKDWDVVHKSAKQEMEDAKAALAVGNWPGAIGMLYAAICVEGLGGDYESTRGLSNKELGLPEENLDEIIKEALLDGSDQV